MVSLPGGAAAGADRADRTHRVPTIAGGRGISHRRAAWRAGPHRRRARRGDLPAMPRRDAAIPSSGAIAIRSPTAPIAGRACRSSRRFPTTGKPPRCGGSASARPAQPNTTTPDDRRFHAQPIACHACGPRAWLERGDGRPFALDAITTLDDVDGAATLLMRGQIIAIKGLGGFQLACDATDGGAVARLRERSAGPRKPFALMVRDIECRAAIAASTRRGTCCCKPAPRSSSVGPRAGPGVGGASHPASARSASCCRTRRCTICCCGGSTGRSC